MPNASETIITFDTTNLKPSAILPGDGSIAIVGTVDPDGLIGCELEDTDYWTDVQDGKMFVFDGITTKFTDYIGNGLKTAVTNVDYIKDALKTANSLTGNATAYQSDPPAVPVDGDTYIILGIGTGDWVGEDEKVAIYVTDTWTFVAGVEADVVLVSPLQNGTGTNYVFNGTTWEIYTRTDGIYTIDWITDEWTMAEDATKSGGDPIGGFTENNLYIALQLFREANPTTKIYCYPIKTTFGGTVAEPTSLTIAEASAFSDLLNQHEVTAVQLAGRGLISTVITHCETAENSTYRTPRICIAGYGMEHITDGGIPDFSFIVANQDDNGRAVVYVGTAAKTFRVFDENGNSYEMVIHLGGHFLSSYLAGIILGNRANDTFAHENGGWLGTQARKYQDEGAFMDVNNDGLTNYFYPATYPKDILGANAVNYVYKRGIKYKFGLAKTFSAGASPFNKLMSRKIYNKLYRDLDVIADGYYKYLNRMTIHRLLESEIKRYLSELANNNYIQQDYNVVVTATDQDVIDGIMNVTITFRMVGEIDIIKIKLEYGV